MAGARRRLLRAVVVASSLAVLLAPRRAGAEIAASIQYESAEQLELARRIASELASGGYAVDISATSEPSPCDLDGPKSVNVPRGTKAWIRLSADPADSDRVVATICYLGAQPFLQQAAPSAPRADAHQLALATAEALNGLHSKLPPIEGGAESAPVRQEPAPPSRVEREPEIRREPAKRFVNSAVLGTAVVWNLPDFPAMPGVTARATLGIAPSVGLLVDAFVPAGGPTLERNHVSVKVRTSWLRVGPRLDGALGNFDFSAAALAGPALTWVTAVAAPPLVGTTDASPSALLTLSALVEYPRRGSVFACASASVSMLLPGIEVDLGDGLTTPRGSWPLEASIGFGARWGVDP